MPEVAKSTPSSVPQLRRLRVPEHADVAEVGERVAEGRELPVEHRDDPRLGRVEHHVLGPVVAVRDGGGLVGRHALRQLGDQALHRLDVAGLGAAVLLGPAVDLAGEVVAGAAVVAKPDRRVVDLVQAGERRVQLVVDGGALGRLEARQPRVAEDAAGQVVHHVEGRADHALVEAERAHVRDRKAGRPQRLHHPVLAVDLVGARQELAGRLLAQHAAAGRRRTP